MNLACPRCGTVYRLDPARIQGEGVDARCRECEAVLRVDAGASNIPGDVVTAAVRPTREPTPAPDTRENGGGAAGPAATAPGSTAAAGGTPAASPAPQTPPPSGAPVFGPQDPDTRARRLARALVSDIKVYNREKWSRSQASGMLRTEFRDEILKSWDEYVEQVGEEMAKKTPYFRDALNDILAGGDRVF